VSPRVEVAQVVTRFIAGAGGVALRGALALDAERFHVTIITGEGGPLLEKAEAAGMRVIVEPSLVSPIAPRSDATALARLTTLMEQHRFDVVHTHSAKAGALGRVAAHRAGVPLVVHTYHGFPFHEFQSAGRRAAYVAIERRLAAYTDVVLAIGSGVALEALRRGLARPGALRTVTPVVDGRTVARTPAASAHARDLLGLPAEATVVGTVGRLDYQKAPEHLVEAVAALRHRDTYAVWIGSGPDLDQVRRLVAEAGLEKRFVLAGERTDVPDLLPALDMFVMASRYEGLPCALVEAMRCGLPAVVTAVNSVPDLVVPGESGLLVPPGRPALLAEAIDDQLDHPDRAARMARRGRVLAADARYDAEQLGGVLTEVYTSRASAPAQLLSRAG
jgi:glycosyltransferase involved in cell wall biosynthesis